MPANNPLAYFDTNYNSGQLQSPQLASQLTEALFGEISERPNAVKPSISDFKPDELAALANDDERRRRAGFTVSEVENALMLSQARPARNSAPAVGTPVPREEAGFLEKATGARQSLLDALNMEK